MSHETLIQNVQDVFRSVFEDPQLSIRRDMTAEDVEGWDSFAHVNLIMALEVKFGITFRLSELQDLSCVGDMLDVLAGKLGVAA